MQKGHRKVWLYPQMFVPFLDDRSFCRPGHAMEAAKSKQPEKSGTKSTIPKDNTWKRHDEKAEVFRTVLKGGPDWNSVTRRVTYDLYTKEVIDDEENPHEHENRYLYREIPGAPRDIRTIFHFIQPESEPEPLEANPAPATPEEIPDVHEAEEAYLLHQRPLRRRGQSQQQK